MRSIARTAATITGALLLCAGGTARAGTFPVVEANVPFPFVVNGQNFPAGKYLIQRDDTSPSILLIEGDRHNHAAAFVLTEPHTEQSSAGARPSLEFKRDENRYRLMSVRESNGDGWDLVRR